MARSVTCVFFSLLRGLHTYQSSRRSGLFSRRGIARSERFGDVTLREFACATGVSCAPLIDGLPGSGMTAAIVAAYLSDHLRLPVVAELVSPK